MNKSSKILLSIFLALGLIVAILYWMFLQIDFVGEKDPKTVQENLKRWNNTILSAEYRFNGDYCEVKLLDSINIEINVGNNNGGLIVSENYKISGDTIVFTKEIPGLEKYIKSNKFLIKDDKLLYKIDSKGKFDTIIAMKIKFNKIKTQ